VCDSVGRRLEGQRLAGFTGVVTFVRSAFEEALSGILNKRAVDVLLDIKKSQVRPRCKAAGGSDWRLHAAAEDIRSALGLAWSLALWLPLLRRTDDQSLFRGGWALARN
jgi:hypothetical protein